MYLLGSDNSWSSLDVRCVPRASSFPTPPPYTSVYPPPPGPTALGTKFSTTGASLSTSGASHHRLRGSKALEVDLCTSGMQRSPPPGAWSLYQRVGHRFPPLGEHEQTHHRRVCVWWRRPLQASGRLGRLAQGLDGEARQSPSSPSGLVTPVALASSLPPLSFGFPLVARNVTVTMYVPVRGGSTHRVSHPHPLHQTAQERKRNACKQ